MLLESRKKNTNCLKEKHMKLSTLTLVTAVALLLSCSLSSAVDAPQASIVEAPHYAMSEKPKKLIHFGWREPKTIAHFNRPIEELDRYCPVDGIGIRPVFKLKRGDKVINYGIERALGAPEAFCHEDFAEWIPALKRLQQTRMKHNFILTASVLFNADWFDDAAWERTMNNFENLAWLAKQSEFEGLCLDIEAYPFCGMPFKYRAELGHTFDETQIQVRKRAADWITRINKQFPDIVLFTFFWTSQCNSAHAAAHPEDHFMGNTGLQNAFFNGVYDAAPWTMKIIDGNELTGYNACTESDFQASVGNYLRFSKAWIDPRNHAKFDHITQMASALYVDSYVPRKNTDGFNIFAKTDNPTALLCQNIEYGLKYSDEYAWLWAEKGTFWPTITGTKDMPFWNDKLPMATEAILAGKNPIESAIRYAGESILINSELNPGDSDIPEGPGQTNTGIASWALYQPPDQPAGTVTPENGMARFRNCASALLCQATSKIKPGQKYLVTARAKVESANAQPTLRWFYRNTNGRVNQRHKDGATFVPDKDGWLKATAIITIPHDPEIARLAITCGMNGTGKEGPGDKGVLIDDIELRPIIYPWTK